MNYYFTGLIILALTILALFVEPAYPRNEYLNEYGVRCGEIDFRIEDRNRDTDYRTSNSSDYDNDEQNFSITFRKYLGTDCKTSKENVAIKQQLELMKMCGRVNSNPSLALNENFRLLVSKCRGVTPAGVTPLHLDTNSLKFSFNARLGLLLTLPHIFINSNCCLIATFSFEVLQSVPKYFLKVILKFCSSLS